MEYTKDKINLKDGLEKEWLITNGIGGFASSTVIGANTRKYHGLLIAPLTPPARRFLVLSKVDESIIIDNNKYDLYTNVCTNYISQGFKYQEGFDKDIFPSFKYDVQGVKISKTICMEQGKNIVGIYYKIKNINKDTKFTLAPIVNFRDFHTMSTGHEFVLNQMIHGDKVKLIIDKKPDLPVYMYLSDGQYIKHENDTFRNMFYIEEEKRGFYPEENHAVSGVYEVDIKPNEEKEISFIFGLEENIEEINLKKIIKEEEARIEKIVQNTELMGNSKFSKQKKELIKELIKASDQFIVYRPSFGLHTIIAGYPWFLDWGRDSLIAFEGLLLITKRFDLAREIILTMIRDIKFGLVPNGYSGFDNRPLYNSADSSLLLFEQIQKYINYTGDYKFIQENIYESLEKIIRNYMNVIDIDDNNIYMDEDYLISSGTEKTQNTWMDAKYGDFPATPRNGKTVEINSLWYNSLMIMADLSEKIGNHQENVKLYLDVAKKCKKSFNEKFYNKRRKCLYDVLGDGKIRPNQLFALSLTYPVIKPDSEEAYNIINTVEKKLLNNYGLKSLAKGEENYVEIYEGNSFKRDMSYHQGITWTWLLGIYYDSLRNMIKTEKRKTYKTELEKKLKDFINTTTKTFENEIFDRGCIGSIAEIYDSCKPYSPKGTIAQAWSVSEILRIILQ